MGIGNVDIIQGIDVHWAFEQLSAYKVFSEDGAHVAGACLQRCGVIVVKDEPAICRRRLSQTVLLSPRSYTPLVGDFSAMLIHKHRGKKTIGKLFQRDIFEFIRQFIKDQIDILYSPLDDLVLRGY